MNVRIEIGDLGIINILMVINIMGVDNIVLESMLSDTRRDIKKFCDNKENMVIEIFGVERKEGEGIYVKVVD